MKHGLVLTSVLILGTAASTAWSLGINDPHGPLRFMPSSFREITLHSSAFRSQGALRGTPRGFSLLQRGAISLTDAVRGAFYGTYLKHQAIEVRVTEGAELGLRSGSESVDVRFFVAGIPLCGHLGARVTKMTDLSVLAFGSVPEISNAAAVPSEDEWPDESGASQAALDAVRELSERDDARITSKERCIDARADQFVPTWHYLVTSQGEPYDAFSTGVDAHAVPHFFTVDGKARVYDRNPLSALTDVTLTGLTGDGTLTSEFLKTVVPKETFEQAKSETHEFVFDPTDKRFAEAQAYSAVQRHYDFTKSVGFEWYGPKPVLINLHVKPGGRSNNALFVPGTSDASPPTISIDDGDGIDLQFLALDYDVVAHEFGHHVVYRTLKSTTGQSLALHEGLADALAFFSTGDPCLGESICPKDSNACIVKGQCLRTAALDLKYADDTWKTWAGSRNRLGHLHGQLISGLMWDLRVTNAIPADLIPKLIVKAVSFFKEASGFGDFLLALYSADQELAGGQYTEAIRTAATNRGMSDFLTGGGPTDNAISPGGTTGGSTGETGAPEKKETRGDENPLRCGTIAYGQPSSPWMLALMLLAPFFALMLLRPAPATVRPSKRRQGRTVAK